VKRNSQLLATYRMNRSGTMAMANMSNPSFSQFVSKSYIKLISLCLMNFIGIAVTESLISYQVNMIL